MRIRYVDGSGAMPRGVRVAVLEGVCEVVIQLDLTACPTLLMGSLTRVLTEWANQRWLYAGPGDVREYVYELAHLPGEWAHIAVEDGGVCRVLVDPSGPGDVVLDTLSEVVTAAASRSWVWVGPVEVTV